MANPWFRLYSEFAFDPKIQVVTEALQRRYVMLLCLHCDNKLVGRPDDEIALALRISMDEWQSTKSTLIERGLINDDITPYGWDKRQFISDIKDSTAAERQARYRESKRNNRNATVTSRPPESDTDTDTDSNTNVVADAVKTTKPKPYTPAFENFWSAYPRKVNKLAASKAYTTAIKQTGVTHENLSLSATQFAAAHRSARTEEQFIPHPATWLNKGGWENDLSGIKPSTGAAPAAANARGSQFSAVKSAVAELLAESNDGTPSGSGKHVYPNLALPDSRGRNVQSDSGYAGGHDTTSGQTIDCDVIGSIDG